MYYQRLKHMVADKVHSRSTGPMVLLTRQPTEGRAKNGALRLGEMERDVLISGGYSSFLNERFVKSADGFSMHVCKSCGLIAAFNAAAGIHLCKLCDNTTDFSRVETPYATKLLFHELLSIGIGARIITEN